MHRATLFFLTLALIASIISQAIGAPEDDNRERLTILTDDRKSPPVTALDPLAGTLAEAPLPFPLPSN